MNHKVNCEWGDWIIGDCSQTCGEGTRTNTRVPEIVAEHGGEECSGPSSIVESCQMQNCPGINTRSLAKFNPLMLHFNESIWLVKTYSIYY